MHQNNKKNNKYIIRQVKIQNKIQTDLIYKKMISEVLELSRDQSPTGG